MEKGERKKNITCCTSRQALVDGLYRVLGVDQYLIATIRVDTPDAASPVPFAACSFHQFSVGIRFFLPRGRKPPLSSRLKDIAVIVRSFVPSPMSVPVGTQLAALSSYLLPGAYPAIFIPGDTAEIESRRVAPRTDCPKFIAENGLYVTNTVHPVMNRFCEQLRVL